MDRSENMRRIKGRDTSPEMAVRRIVHGMGYRYRLHQMDLPGRPDLVFSGRRKIIQIHGCFWHSHGCDRSHTPGSNTGYWIPKLERNQKRDAANARALRELGWNSLIIWECEVSQPTKIRTRISRFLK